MILDAKTGDLITSRTYKLSNIAHRLEARQIIIGSFPTNYAFVLSSVLQSGQHLFKFDPLTFNPSAIWAKRTFNSDIRNAINYGIIFGSSESVLYTYGYHDGAFKVSRINADSLKGSVSWTYGLKGNLTDSQAISQKQIDSTLEVVGFAS